MAAGINNITRRALAVAEKPSPRVTRPVWPVAQRTAVTRDRDARRAIPRRVQSRRRTGRSASRLSGAAGGPPQGTVTFLFSDVEGSTRLLRQLGERYAAVLADHEQLLQGAFAAHGGREIDTQGDAFFFAFARARDAVAAAVEAQRALVAHTWPEGAEARVRMGLHTGEPRRSGERYVGLGVHRAARICAVANGGQIVLSSVTRGLVEEELPPHISFRDLGEYRLKDFDTPEHLFEVDAVGLRT